MQVTLTACDKDSSAGYVKTVVFDGNQDFLEQYAQFEKEVPFPRWYVEVTSEDDDAERLAEQWIA